MSNKQEFWDSINSVPCPECGKEYQHRMSMIHHMIRVHGHKWDKAKEIVDNTGIYCPPTYRQR